MARVVLLGSPKENRLVTNFQQEIASAASVVGPYMMQHEFDTLIDEAMESHWYFLREGGVADLDEVFNEHFLPWTKGYVYYSALVCSCKSEQELVSQLREDFDELYMIWSQEAQELLNQELE